MLSLLYPLDGELPEYSREQFLADLCDEVRGSPVILTSCRLTCIIVREGHPPVIQGWRGPCIH